MDESLRTAMSRSRGVLAPAGPRGPGRAASANQRGRGHPAPARSCRPFLSHPPRQIDIRDQDL